MKGARPQAVGTVQLDDDAVRVTEWRFPPGAETGWHRHGFDYVVVPVTAGRLKLETPDGEVSAELAPGRSYARKEGVEHNVINDGSMELVFVEIELKPR